MPVNFNKLVLSQSVHSVARLMTRSLYRSKNFSSMYLWRTKGLVYLLKKLLRSSNHSVRMRQAKFVEMVLVYPSAKRFVNKWMEK